MIVSTILYILSERELYGYGMVFDIDGAFLYVLSPSDIPVFVNSENMNLTIIDPLRKKVFTSPEEKCSINKISSYFYNIFKQGSPVRDTSFFLHQHSNVV